MDTFENVFGYATGVIEMLLANFYVINDSYLFMWILYSA